MFGKLKFTSLLCTFLSLVNAAPTVTIKDGTVVGTSTSGYDTFFGIPFAQPPIGQLRLKPPQPLSAPFGTIQATATPTACPQAYQAGLPIGENCLNINVYRPSSANAASKLPVLLWLYGGGFIGGWNTLLNGSYFVRRSVELNQPFIFVAPNYRLNGFGFLAGKQLQQEGSTNLGLRDQRLALQWVQDNIAAFGGDPTKVTLWGNSAGSISVMDHTIINSGDNTYNGRPLFRGAIMNSGTILPAAPVNSKRGQDLFDAVAKGAGCDPTSATVLTCLRSAPYNTLLQASSNGPGNIGYQNIDFAYIPRADNSSAFFPFSPEEAVILKKFSKQPIIAGDVEDEGTSFVKGFYASTTSDLITALTKHWATITTDNATTLVNSYSDDPSYGSPFRTGTKHNIYPQYKRLAAIIGDATFDILRRGYLSISSGEMDAYTFLSTFLYETSLAGDQGTYHSTDITILTYETPGLLVPRDSYLTYYTNFIASGNPNTNLGVFPAWPKWKYGELKMLNISLGNVETIVDNYRAQNYQTIIGMLPALKL